MLCTKALHRCHSISITEATAYCKDIVRFNYYWGNSIFHHMWLLSSCLSPSYLATLESMHSFWKYLKREKYLLNSTSAKPDSSGGLLTSKICKKYHYHQGNLQQEPISICINETLQQKLINPKLLFRLVDYQLYEMEKLKVRTMKDLEIYGENTRSLLLYMTLHMLGINDDNTYKAASHLGIGLFRHVHGYMRCAEKDAILYYIKAILHSRINYGKSMRIIY